MSTRSHVPFGTTFVCLFVNITQHFVDHHISSPLNYHWVGMHLLQFFSSHTEGKLFLLSSVDFQISRTECILLGIARSMHFQQDTFKSSVFSQQALFHLPFWNPRVWVPEKERKYYLVFQFSKCKSHQKKICRTKKCVAVPILKIFLSILIILKLQSL